MTREEIICKAREIAVQCCNRMPSWQNDYAMTRIMELIDASAAAEREAMVAEAAKQGWAMKNEDPFKDAVREIAVIRARGQI